MKKTLVTGAGGFIGGALCRHLSTQGFEVIPLQRRDVDLADASALNAVFKQHQPQVVVHLASQASPTGSDLAGYLQNNVTNHNNVLEAARLAGSVEHIIYASSYGVYGRANQAPQAETDSLQPPTSFYAATKYTNETITGAWAAQSKISCTGLRLFNVYGPQGRPGTMPMFFAEKLLKGEPVPLYNGGQLVRDFVFINDVTEAIALLIEKPTGTHAVYNIGSGQGITTISFTQQLANALGCEAKIDNRPNAPNEVAITYANLSAIKKHIGWVPRISLESGLKIFADWFRQRQPV